MPVPEDPLHSVVSAPPKDLPPFRRILLMTTGLLALLLGLIGIVVPGLPTTPFVLLSAACLARSSPRLHHKLVSNRHLGPLIRDWEANRSLTRRTKWLSTTIMTTMVVVSALQFSGRPVLQALVLSLGAVGCVVVWRIPTRR